MLAICIGDYFNISNENMQQNIENYIPSNNRSQIIETKTNIEVSTKTKYKNKL